jgi:hypothetical protein
VLAQCNSAASTSLESAIQNGGYWLVLQEGDGAYVRWSADSSTYASFFMQDSTTPAWGTSTGVFSVVRIGGYGGCDNYYPNLNRTYNEPLLTADNAVDILFSTFPTARPSGYAGDPIPASEPHAKHVAMGDSFSSGEGNPSFEAGSATSTDKCHRSPVAYPRLLNSSLNLGAMAFVACSGAKTSNVLHGGSADGAWGESPQIDALSDDTEVVTITIGGNDVGFTDYAIACTEMLCGPGSFDYNHIMGAINDSGFFDDLEETYESIFTHAPNAQVYVSGYPFLAAEDSDVCGAVDLTGAWAVQDQLNEVMEDAVEDVQSTLLTTRLHYIDPNQTGSPFIGKHLCNGGASDFTGLMSPVTYSLHPNADGHEDFESVFASAIS